MPNIGWTEIVIVLIILILIFGPKRLPQLGKSIGQSIRGFKKGVEGHDEEPPEIEKPADAEEPVRMAEEIGEEKPAEKA